jgi:uncharacterized alkaline shock family protein YloU
MEKIIHMENDKYIGRTQFSPKLLPDAIALTVKDVAGVARLGRKVKLNSTDGVRIFEEEDGLIIDIILCVEYGYTVADVSYRVQETVISTASQLIERKVSSVNIKVIGTKVTKDRKKIPTEPAVKTEKDKKNEPINK